MKMTYTARNVSLDELMEFGCDVFSEAKRRKVDFFYAADDDDCGIQSLLEDRDVDYIRHFH